MQIDLILTRALREPPESKPLPEGFTVRHVHDPLDEAAYLIDGFCSDQHFPANWSRQRFENEAEAVAIFKGNLVVAAGWLTRKPFYIEEIRRTFDPGPTGDYYFGDFVAPSERGKGLQRTLIRERLGLSSRTGRQWAHAITRPTIPASLSNYESQGFSVSARLCKRVGLGLELTRFCCTNDDASSHQISREGWGLPFSFYLRPKA